MITYHIPHGTKFESGPADTNGKTVGVDMLMELTGNVGASPGIHGIRFSGPVCDIRHLRDALSTALRQAATLRSLMSEGVEK